MGQFTIKTSGNKFQLIIQNGNLYDALKSLGFDTTQSGDVSVPVTITAGGQTYTQTVALTYKAKAGKQGKASKKPKKK